MYILKLDKKCNKFIKPNDKRRMVVAKNRRGGSTVTQLGMNRFNRNVP